MFSDRFNLFLHLVAFALYMGSTAAMLIIIPSVVGREAEPARRLRVLAALFRIYDPFVIAALGVLVMTGAFSLTGYKAALRGGFFNQIGSLLVWKLFFAFLLINVAAYMAFGIGHRVVRFADADELPEPAWVDSMMKRWRSSAVLALILTAMVLWVAMQMTHSYSLPAPQTSALGLIRAMG